MFPLLTHHTLFIAFDIVGKLIDWLVDFRNEHNDEHLSKTNRAIYIYTYISMHVFVSVQIYCVHYTILDPGEFLSTHH